MKIDRTEGEFRRAIKNLLTSPWSNSEQRVDALIQAEGLEFKEEEPELPERLCCIGVTSAGSPSLSPRLAPELAKTKSWGASRDYMAALHREAAARWNAVSRLCNSNHPIYPKTIEDIVRQEREKLQ